MKVSDIGQLRLQNQQVASPHYSEPESLLNWMGAMQAQDFPMLLWALGVRLKGQTNNSLTQAYKEGRIIRTHLLRPTWHLVAAADLHWMLELTAPRILRKLKSRHKQLELTPELIARSNHLICHSLENLGPLTQNELKPILEGAGISVAQNRLYHLLLRAELDKLICSGPPKGKVHSFALLEERVPQKQSLSEEESIVLLTKRYFQSHGPATLKDFVWWSGLGKTEARNALNELRGDFVSEQIAGAGDEYWYSREGKLLPGTGTGVFMLPAYDEYVISYQNRSMLFPESKFERSVSSNGVFRATIVHQGQIIGIWKRQLKSKKLIVEMFPFQPLPRVVMDKLKIQAGQYAQFLNLELNMLKG